MAQTAVLVQLLAPSAEFVCRAYAQLVKVSRGLACFPKIKLRNASADAEDGTVDLCGVDPGYDVDLHVRSSLRSMTAVWMGHSTLQREIDAGAIQLIGDKALARRMHEWLGLSSFAKEKRQIAN